MSSERSPASCAPAFERSRERVMRPRDEITLAASCRLATAYAGASLAPVQAQPAFADPGTHSRAVRRR